MSVNNNSDLKNHSRFKKSELELLRALFDDVPLLMCVLEGPEHRLKYMNQNLQKLYGSREFPSGTTVRKLWPELFKQKVNGGTLFDIMDHVYDTGKSYTFNEFGTKIEREKTGASEIRYFNFTWNPLKGKDGEVYGIYFAGYEVTEYVKARKEKTKSEQRFSLALEGAKLGFWEIDIVNQKVDYMSAQCKAHYGVPPEEDFELEDFYKAVHPDDHSHVNDKIKEAVEEDKLYEAEFRVHWPDDSVHWLLARGQCMRDEEGNPVYLVGITIEITPQKETERKLKEAVKIRDDFLSIASHELQTPVTSIKARAELFERRMRGAGQEKYADEAAKINDRIDQLSQLTGRLLDISRMQEGKLSLEKEVFSLAPIIDEAVDTLDHISDHTIEVQGETQKKIYADRNRISQVLTNLLGNAIKYSPQDDRVIIRVSDEEEQVIVSVIDFGIGIAEIDHKRIFERFFKGTGDNKQTYPGFGIGLYICEQIIRRHDGEIWVEDNPEGGSIFKFVLPTSE